MEFNQISFLVVLQKDRKTTYFISTSFSGITRQSGIWDRYFSIFLKYLVTLWVKKAS